jgi:hypothetical protein
MLPTPGLLSISAQQYWPTNHLTKHAHDFHPQVVVLVLAETALDHRWPILTQQNSSKDKLVRVAGKSR